MPKIIALIVSGGCGSRCKYCAGIIPKQYSKFKGKSILEHSIEPLAKHSMIDGFCVVTDKQHDCLYGKLTKQDKFLCYADAGGKRQDSVFSGLLRIEEFNPDFVLIHDAVRPFTSQSLITNVINELRSNVAVVPAINIDETVGLINLDKVEQVINRDYLRLMQTPQGFDFKLLLKLYIRSLRGNQNSNNIDVFTDEVSIMTKYNYPVKIIQGSLKNIKITHSKDIQLLNGVSPDYFIEN